MRLLGEDLVERYGDDFQRRLAGVMPQQHVRHQAIRHRE